MRFATSAMALVASAAVSSAATVQFWTLDNATRIIYFTGNADVASVTVSSKENTTVEVPGNFSGNFYAVKEGQANTPGMLGEVTFGSWAGLTYFDVSAIVDPNDTDNVGLMWPVGATKPHSGCPNFPCNDAYYLPDDVQTKATDKTAIWCTLGSGSPPGITFTD